MLQSGITLDSLIRNQKGKKQMRMKKAVLPILVLLLVCLCASALGDIWYVKTPNGKSVNIRDTSNNVIGQIPYGESVIPESDKCTETVAYVEYHGVSGYVKWNYLVREQPDPWKKSSKTTKIVESGETVIYGEGQHSVSITGGVLQFQNKKKKATGTKYSEVKFDDPVPWWRQPPSRKRRRLIIG